MVLNFILAARVNAIGYLSYNYFFFLDFILTQLANSKGKKKKKKEFCSLFWTKLLICMENPKIIMDFILEFKIIINLFRLLISHLFQKI